MPIPKGFIELRKEQLNGLLRQGLDEDEITSIGLKPEPLNQERINEAVKRAKKYLPKKKRAGKRRKTAPIIVESGLGIHYLYCGGCHASLDSLRRKIMAMIFMKPAERKPLRCPKCKILLNFKRIGTTT